MPTRRIVNSPEQTVPLKQSLPDPILVEIRDLLKTQQALLKDIRNAHQGRGFLGRMRWWFMLLLAAIVLAVGSLGAYQYYHVLQSIIDQYPH